MHDLPATLVYAAASRQVTDTWVAGRHVFADGTLRYIDEAAVLERAEAWRARIDAGLESSETDALSTHNVDPAEIARFEAAASRWWDPQGEMRPLHDLNPVRLQYVERAGALAGTQGARCRLRRRPAGRGHGAQGRAW